MFGTDIIDSIPSAAEKSRLTDRLQDATKVVAQIWHFADFIFLCYKGRQELESFCLQKPPSVSKYQMQQKYLGNFSKPVTRARPPTVAKRLNVSREAHLERIRLLLNDSKNAKASVVNLLRIDDAVLIACSDGQICAYRYDVVNDSPVSGWLSLRVSEATPLANKTADFEITSVGMNRESSPYTMYWYEQLSTKPQDSPWNGSIRRRHFRLQGVPLTDVIFEDEGASPILYSCPKASFVFGNPREVTIWFPPSMLDDVTAVDPSESIIARCSPTFQITGAVLGGYGRERLCSEQYCRPKDFWTICVEVLSELAANSGRRILNVIATKSSDRLVVHTHRDVCFVDRKGKILSSHPLPPNSEITKLGLVGSFLCLIGASNRIWITDLGDNWQFEKWVPIDCFANFPLQQLIQSDDRTIDSIIIWSADGVYQVTVQDMQLAIATRYPLKPSGSIASLISSWDTAYRQRRLPQFHHGLRVTGPEPPLDYSVALPMILVHNSVDHESATPKDVLLASEALSLLDENLSTSSGRMAPKQHHLKMLFELYRKMERVLQADD